MKIALAVLAVTFAALGFAAKSGHAANLNPARIDVRKSAILKRLDDRIAHIQQERACIQAAVSQDDIKTCQERFGIGNKPAGQKPSRNDLNQKPLASP